MDNFPGRYFLLLKFFIKTVSYIMVKPGQTRANLLNREVFVTKKHGLVNIFFVYVVDTEIVLLSSFILISVYIGHYNVDRRNARRALRIGRRRGDRYEQGVGGGGGWSGMNIHRLK